jgi:ABC-type multidrug transport system ATPase subunit
VDGRPLPGSFKTNISYIQQHDIHLEILTICKALRFLAISRQPFDVPKSEKLASVEEIIYLLNIGDFADAVIELAGKPALPLFLDEPTSGLDSYPR